MSRSLGRRLQLLERQQQVPAGRLAIPPSRQLLHLLAGMRAVAEETGLVDLQRVLSGSITLLDNDALAGRTDAAFEAVCTDFLAVATPPVVVVGRVPTLDEQLAGFLDNVDRLHEQLRALLP